CGERRYLAALKLGLPAIPARILDAITQKDEVLAFQLTENLQREDLNPIDQAKGILAYIQAKHPDMGYDVDGVMSDLVKVMRAPEYASQGFLETVSKTLEISGKTAKTLYNGLSLLKLSSEIQAASRAGNLSVSQGYLFAANLDCPDRDKIFEAIMKTPVTNANLNNLLTAWKKAKPDPSKTKPLPMKKQIASLRSYESRIEMGFATYTRPDLEMLVDELRTFLALVEMRVPIAPMPAPGKKKPPQL
ncbi:MAG: hypothetical protein WCQ90_07765, partial [Deltaproteobacteria bacterium]